MAALKERMTALERCLIRQSSIKIRNNNTNTLLSQIKTVEKTMKTCVFTGHHRASKGITARCKGLHMSCAPCLHRSAAGCSALQRSSQVLNAGMMRAAARIPIGESRNN